MNTIEKAINELIELEGYGIYSHEVEEGNRLMIHRKNDEELDTISENRIVKSVDALRTKLLIDNSKSYVDWLFKYYYTEIIDYNIEELLALEL